MTVGQSHQNTHKPEEQESSKKCRIFVAVVNTVKRTLSARAQKVLSCPFRTLGGQPGSHSHYASRAPCPRDSGRLWVIFRAPSEHDFAAGPPDPCSRCFLARETNRYNGALPSIARKGDSAAVLGRSVHGTVDTGPGADLQGPRVGWGAGGHANTALCSGFSVGAAAWGQ